MNLRVERRWKKDTYVIGVLFVDGVRFCETLEDKDRGLKQSDPLSVIKARKVYQETAIPTGVYEVAMDTVSPKYNASAWYRKVCQGKVPRLLDVPGWEGVLLHTGNNALQTAGCLLVGRNTKVGQLTESKATFEKLYKKMKSAHDKGEKITIQIV
jgi:hypothetical protein